MDFGPNYKAALSQKLSGVHGPLKCLPKKMKALKGQNKWSEGGYTAVKVFVWTWNWSVKH